METLSVLPALCERNPLVTGEFPSQRVGNADFYVFLDVRIIHRSPVPVTGGLPSQMVSNTDFNVFFDVSLYQWLNKPLSCWWS